MHSRHRSFLIRQYLMPVIATVLAVLIVGALLLYQNHRKNIRQSKSELTHAIHDKSTILSLDDEEFKSLLARSSSDQLTRLALDLADEPTQQLAVRMDRIKKRIAILNRLLELDSDEQVRNYAISSKFAALMDREYIAAANNLYDEFSPTQLREFAVKHSQSENGSVANAAAAAVAVAAISEFLRADTSRQRSELAKPAVEKLQSTARDTVNDFSVAKRLQNWVTMVQSSGDASQNQMFVDAFIQGYGSSTTDTIAGLATQIRKSSGSSGLDLIEVVNSRPGNRQQSINQLVSQVEAALGENDVPESSRLQILSRAEDLLRLGWNLEAESIRQQLEPLPNDQVSDELKRELAKFDQRAKLFNAPFDISSFTDRSSQPAEFKSTEAEYKILFFISVANNDQPIVEFKQLVKTLRGDLLNSKVEIAVVYLDRNDDSEGLANLKKFAAQNGRWQVWFLTIPSSAGQEFLARVPIDTTPYVVVLGKNNEVISLDPPIFSIKEIALAKLQQN